MKEDATSEPPNDTQYTDHLSGSPGETKYSRHTGLILMLVKAIGIEFVTSIFYF
jgi:hypothetical protein